MNSNKTNPYGPPRGDDPRDTKVAAPPEFAFTKTRAFERFHTFVTCTVAGMCAFLVPAFVIHAQLPAFSRWDAVLASAGAGAILSPVTYFILRNRWTEFAVLTLSIGMGACSTLCAIFYPPLIPIAIVAGYAGFGLLIRIVIPKEVIEPNLFRCVECDYDLAGIPGDVCPECGKHIDSCSAERELPS